MERYYLEVERPLIEQIFKRLGVKIEKAVDVGAEVGYSAQLLREFGASYVIGYEVNPAYCKSRLNVFNEYYCREMDLSEYEQYIIQGYFIKMDCEGCEEKYLLRAIPAKGFICIHSWVQNHEDLAYQLIRSGYIPVFHSYDWKEICYLKL